MDHRIHQVPNPYAFDLPIVQKPKTKDVQTNFKEILTKEQQQTLKISKHASERLNERNIHINDTQWQTIEAKVQEAKEKGITDSLIVMNDAALIVSTKNNTVVTALDREEATSKIFTNINGTILMND